MRDKLRFVFVPVCLFGLLVASFASGEITPTVLLLVWLGFHMRDFFRIKHASSSLEPEKRDYAMAGSNAVSAFFQGMIVVISVIFVTTHAINNGGWWWLLALIFGITAIIVGEDLKINLEQAVVDSKKKPKC